MAITVVSKGGHCLPGNVYLMTAAVFLIKVCRMKRLVLSVMRFVVQNMTITINMLLAIKAGKWLKANVTCVFAIMPFILTRNVCLMPTAMSVFRETMLNTVNQAAIPAMNLKTGYVLKAVNIPVPACQVIAHQLSAA